VVPRAEKRMAFFASGGVGKREGQLDVSLLSRGDSLEVAVGN